MMSRSDFICQDILKGLYYEIDRALSLLDKDGYKISFKKLVSILRNESIFGCCKRTRKGKVRVIREHGR